MWCAVPARRSVDARGTRCGYSEPRSAACGTRPGPARSRADRQFVRRSQQECALARRASSDAARGGTPEIQHKPLPGRASQCPRPKWHGRPSSIATPRAQCYGPGTSKLDARAKWVPTQRHHERMRLASTEPELVGGQIDDRAAIEGIVPEVKDIDRGARVHVSRPVEVYGRTDAAGDLKPIVRLKRGQLESLRCLST
jgi:hypothetical protein